MRILEQWFWRRYWLSFTVILLLLSLIYGFSTTIVLVALFLTWAYSWIRTFLRKQKKPKYIYRIKYRRKHFRPTKRFTRIHPNYLPTGVKKKAWTDFNRRFNKYKRKHPGRKLTKKAITKIAKDSSHDTIPNKKGAKRHWGRQKIRKMVLKKKGIRYKMR